MITVINNSSWDGLPTKPECECGDIKTYLDKKCINCAAIHHTGPPEEPGVAESFNQLMEDTFHGG